PGTPSGDDTRKDAAQFLLSEMMGQLGLPQRAATYSPSSSQSPGIVVVEKEQLLYKHVVEDQPQWGPSDVYGQDGYLTSNLDETRTLDDKVQSSIDQFLKVVKGKASSEMISKGDLVVVRQIGRGLESEVFLCDWAGKKVVVKSYNVLQEGTNPSDGLSDMAATIHSFSNEAAFMMSLRHKNIMGLLGFGCEPPFRPFVVSEFMPNGSLFDVLGNPGIPLPSDRRKAMLLDAARGLAFLHSCRPPVVHQDFKSLNVLVDTDMTCKVSDFGIARMTHPRARGGGSGSGGGGGGDSGVGVARAASHNRRKQRQAADGID
ncbi:hypothetical protein HK405_001685, partial [Cladochytrium tenue]